MPEVPDVDDVEREVRRFTAEILGVPATTTDLIAEGDVDSLTLEQVIGHVEETYRILLHEEEIDRASFVSSRRFAEVVVDNVRSSPFHA